MLAAALFQLLQLYGRNNTGALASFFKKLKQGCAIGTLLLDGSLGRIYRKRGEALKFCFVSHEMLGL